MSKTERLLARLEAIADSLKGRDSALALLGLGSAGTERHRLDEYSDLDFFVVVREGTKAGYLQSLDWMEAVAPVAWAFQNTRDGHKLLFADGIFCEYAVFEPAEMADAHHPGGKLIWQRPEFDPGLCTPRHLPTIPAPSSREWLVGEALSNLYVGLCRFLRGEKWTASLFVQNYAVGRVADLIVADAAGSTPGRDPYNIDRRFEVRYPEAEAILAACILGYDRTPESARAILAFLETRETINPAIRDEILRLIRLAAEV
ncbi:hypothetical protein GC173_13685 [bacterium]|nr:hypothetical protein [bacterium]